MRSLRSTLGLRSVAGDAISKDQPINIDDHPHTKKILHLPLPNRILVYNIMKISAA